MSTRRRELRMAWWTLRAPAEFYARFARTRIAWGHVRRAFALPDRAKHPIAYLRLARIARKESA